MGKKLMIITNEFPTKVSTFISRDMKILVEAGYVLELYAFYPCTEQYWDFVPEYIKKFVGNKQIIVRHLTKKDYIKSLFSINSYKNIGFFIESFKVLKGSMMFGVKPLQKTLYTVFWTFVLRSVASNDYERVISYWGNYSATAAYLYSKYHNPPLSFITYLHAGVDLYREQVYLLKKLKFADEIITVCQFNVDFLQNLYPADFDVLSDKIHIYHLPIEIRNDISVSKNKNQIIAVGRLDKKKGLNFLIDACNLLEKEKIDFQLLIVGDGPEKNTLVDLVQKYSLKDKVIFTGHVPYREVEVMIAQSTVLAHCSPELGDAVPTVIKESLSVGTPVVGSDIAGIPELLDFGNCGLLFEPASSKSLFIALKTILLDSSLQKNLSNKGKQFTYKMFDINKNKNILLEIISRGKLHDK